MDYMNRSVSLTILGEPASKANSRRLVKFKNHKTGGFRPGSIKSQKALDYYSTFREQLPMGFDLFLNTVEVQMKVYYASRRPDLDETCILDNLQWKDDDRRGVYLNDRQVRRKIVDWGLDKNNPRVELTIIDRPDLDEVKKPKKCTA